MELNIGHRHLARKLWYGSTRLQPSGKFCGPGEPFDRLGGACSKRGGKVERDVT
jgi:hypothetical protein